MNKYAAILPLVLTALVGRPLAQEAPAKEAAPAKQAASVKEAAAPAKEGKVEVREDRIKAIQRKPFLKRGRWHLEPRFMISLNDAFYQRMGGGASIAYHVADSLALELNAAYVGAIQTDMVVFFQQANQALPKVSQLQYWFTFNGQWSPLYGKLSLFNDSILYFDAYLVGGFGLAQTETGSKFTSNLGFGLRYFLTSWMVICLEVRDLIYTEKLRLDIRRTDYTDVQHQLLMSAGVSFFLPTSFEYRYQ